MEDPRGFRVSGLGLLVLGVLALVVIPGFALYPKNSKYPSRSASTSDLGNASKTIQLRDEWLSKVWSLFGSLL